MAITHANPGEVVDISPYGSALAKTKTRALFKTEQIEVIRIVMAAGKEIAEHKAAGDIIVQCLDGEIDFTARGKTVNLQAGQLLYLNAGEPHALRCIEDASFLLTIALSR